MAQVSQEFGSRLPNVSQVLCDCLSLSKPTFRLCPRGAKHPAQVLGKIFDPLFRRRAFVLSHRSSLKTLVCGCRNIRLSVAQFKKAMKKRPDSV
jgi:hypothetical protein